ARLRTMEQLVHAAMRRLEQLVRPGMRPMEQFLLRPMRRLEQLVPWGVRAVERLLRAAGLRTGPRLGSGLEALWREPRLLSERPRLPELRPLRQRRLGQRQLG